MLSKEKSWNKAYCKYAGRSGDYDGCYYIRGCPRCSNLNKFDSKKFHCDKCGWDWKNETS